ENIWHRHRAESRPALGSLEPAVPRRLLDVDCPVLEVYVLNRQPADFARSEPGQRRNDKHRPVRLLPCSFEDARYFCCREEPGRAREPRRWKHKSIAANLSHDVGPAPCCAENRAERTHG